MEGIDGGGGQDEAAADDEVCQVAHKGCGSPLDEELQQDLDELHHHPCRRAEGESSHQNGQLAEVQLVEAGGEGQREVEQMQDHGDGREHADHGQLPGGEDRPCHTVLFPGGLLQQQRRDEYQHDDHKEAQDIHGVLRHILEQFVHFTFPPLF